MIAICSIFWIKLNLRPVKHCDRMSLIYLLSRAQALRLEVWCDYLVRGSCRGMLPKEGASEHGIKGSRENTSNSALTCTTFSSLVQHTWQPSSKGA